MCYIRTFVKNALKPPRKNIIGHRIRLARRRLNPKVTQEDLAGRMAARGIDLNRSAISKIESGVRHVLDYEIKTLAICLKVDPGWFFES
jgi:transcriptional regulator with XRE-family HTH domain